MCKDNTNKLCRINVAPIAKIPCSGVAVDLQRGANVRVFGCSGVLFLLYVL
jgi:hypothetical protein